MPLIAYEIQWDTDGQDVDLPSQIKIPEDITDPDDVSDYLSDQTGFCHKGFLIREAENGEVET